MKVVCLIFSIILGQDGNLQTIQTEKAMESVDECVAWKHQQEHMPPIGKVLADHYVCLIFWEA